MKSRTSKLKLNIRKKIIRKHNKWLLPLLSDQMKAEINHNRKLMTIIVKIRRIKELQARLAVALVSFLLCLKKIRMLKRRLKKKKNQGIK